MCQTPIQELCRLCGQKISYGFDVFIESEEKASLDILINKYLPIKVIEDDALPKKICEPCHIGMAATVDFLDRLVDGQQKLLSVTKQGQSVKNRMTRRLETSPFNLKLIGNNMPSFEFPLDRQHAVDSNVALCLHPDSPNILVNIQGDTPDIEMDDLAQGTYTRKVYEQHTLMKTVDEITWNHNSKKRKTQVQTCLVDTNDNTDRPRRKTNRPRRFKDSVSGADLDSLVKSDRPHDLVSIEEGKSSLKTMSCGNTVIITPNHEEDLMTPASVNIELDFPEGEKGTAKEASVSSVEFVLPPKPLEKFTKTPRHLVVRRKRKKRKWLCDLCKKRFSYRGRYLLHLETHKNSTLHCSVCKTEFNTAQHLKQHQQTSGHAGVGIQKADQPTSCPECKHTFSSEILLEVHTKKCHPKHIDRPYACAYCDKKFARPHSVKEHIIYSHSESAKENGPKYPCDKCGKEFKRKYAQQYHIETIHNCDASYVCTICSKELKTKAALVRHQRFVHSDEKPFSCDICQASFKTKTNLGTHRAIHGSSRQYTCDQCGKQFNYLTSLTVHLKLHSGVKDFECMWCGKKFIQKANLNEHIRIHTGEKPFSCSDCNKNFKTSSQLRMHKKNHKKTFKCLLCRKCFETSELLAEHTSSVHTATSFKCDQCDKYFTDKRYLVKHRKIHPVIEKETEVENLEEKEKSWVLPSLPDDTELGSPHVIYIIPKKDDNSYQYAPLEDDTIFVSADNQMDTLTSIDSVQFTHFDAQINKTALTVGSFDEDNFMKDNSLQFPDDQNNTFV